eukprot:355440-Chlamydomonas_euryale.AAC.6
MSMRVNVTAAPARNCMLVDACMHACMRNEIPGFPGGPPVRAQEGSMNAGEVQELTSGAGRV